jgi:hypothetical protein
MHGEAEQTCFQLSCLLDPTYSCPIGWTSSMTWSLFPSTTASSTFQKCRRKTGWYSNSRRRRKTFVASIPIPGSRFSLPGPWSTAVKSDNSETYLGGQGLAGPLHAPSTSSPTIRQSVPQNHTGLHKHNHSCVIGAATPSPRIRLPPKILVPKAAVWAQTLQRDAPSHALLRAGKLGELSSIRGAESTTANSLCLDPV